MTETLKEAARRFSAPMLAKGFKPAGLHEYADCERKNSFWRIRLKHPETGDKWIRPMHFNGNGFELGEPKFTDGKPLYALHRIASNANAAVWVVEGEQKADALNKLGLVATTSGGATSANAADWQPLRGRAVRIWPDNDDPGKTYAGDVAKILLGIGCAVSCVDVDKLGLGTGEDVIEWLAAHPGAAGSDIEALPILTFPNRENPAGRVTVDGVRLLRGSDLKPEPINWLWRGYLARGKLHIAAGAPGGGKTTIALAVAATVTDGGRWPDGTRAEAGKVLIWSGEDDPGDTLLPRLIAMGANRSRVYFVGDVLTADEARPFDPAADMPALELAAAEVGTISLLIVDPIVNAVAGDGHHNTEVRRSLQPVVDLAARLGAAVLGISHFSKGTAGREPVERVTGSVAFGALPRVVFAVAKTTDDAGNVERIFVRAKSNIGPDGGGFGYALEQSELQGFPGIVASRVLWGQALDGTARDLLATAEAVEDRQERSATDEAIDWLREELRGGPMRASDAQKNARQAGISDKGLRTARERLDIRPRKSAFSGGWEWALPGGQPAQDAQDAQDVRHKNEGTLGGVGHLREPSGGDSIPVDVEI